MDEKLTNRQIQAINTKKKIYSAAYKLMLEKGYENLTIKDICSKSDVSVGAFYHHFKSKEFIIVELYKEMDEHFDTVVAKELELLPTKDKMTSLINHQATFVIFAGIDAAIQIYKSQMTIGNDFFLSPERAMIRQIREVVAENQEANLFVTDMSADEITDEILVIFRGLVYDWCIKDGSYDLVEKINGFLSKIVTLYLV